MYAKSGQVVTFVAGFTASGAAATGLTVTCKVWELRAAGAKSPNDAVGTTATVLEVGGGAYTAQYTTSADCVPLAVFTTAGTADVKAIQTAALSLANLDTAMSTSQGVITTAITNKAVPTAGENALAVWAAATRALTDKAGFSLATAPATAAAIATAVWANATRTLSAVSDSAGVTTLLTRIVGTLLAGNHSPQTGDSFSVVKAGGTGDNAAIKAKSDTIVAITGFATEAKQDAAKVVLDAVALKAANIPAVPASKTDVQVTVPTPIADVDELALATALAPLMPTPTFSGTLNAPTTEVPILSAEERAQLMAIPTTSPSVPTKEEVAVEVDTRLSATHPGNWAAVGTGGGGGSTAGDGTWGWTPTVIAALNPVANARVVVKTSQGLEIGPLFTDASGRCLAGDLPAFRLFSGAYTALIAYNGRVTPFEFSIDANGNEVR